MSPVLSGFIEKGIRSLLEQKIVVLNDEIFFLKRGFNSAATHNRKAFIKRSDLHLVLDTALKYTDSVEIYLYLVRVRTFKIHNKVILVNS